MTVRVSSRRWLTGLCLIAAVPLTLGSSGAAAASKDTGRFLTPFREDGAHYDAATNTFSGGFAKGGRTDANGCLVATDPNKDTGAPKDNPNAYDCLPAGASLVQLPDGNVAFWNALEGEEAITGTNTILTDGGRLTINDESRYLDLSGPTPVFTKPSPVDAGAHQTEHPDDLPLGPFAAQHYSYNNGSMFCSDQVILANGDVIDAGGTDYYTEPYVPVVDKGVVELQGVRNTRIFNAASKRWTAGPVMNIGRWYPSLVTLGNGNLFVASGVNKLIKPVYPTRPADSGTNTKQTETLDIAGSKKWVLNPSSADRSLPLFPRLHLLPNGHVYYDAAGQDFNPAGEAYDEATWNVAASYDPASKTWSDLGIPGTDVPSDPTAAVGKALAAPYAGFRGSTFSAALPMRPSSVVDGHGVYTATSYLTAGGVLGVSPGSYVAVADSRISTVTVNGASETMKTTPTGALNEPRWYGFATPLPNGQVYVSSGANVDEVDAPGSESPILSTELFTPNLSKSGDYTGGTWTKVGDQSRKRTYHNGAILRPDGSVLIGGHAPIGTGYYQTTDTPDLPGRLGTNNHHDASFQVWEPPYLHDPARPVVTDVESHRGTITVSTKDAAHIASVVLMRNTAETHLVDADARTVSLPVLSRDEDSVTVGLPTTSNVLPAGPYLLFANKSKTADLSGLNAAELLPSVGQQLFITGTSVPRVFSPENVGDAEARARAAHRGVPAKKGKHAAGSSAAASTATSAGAPSGDHAVPVATALAAEHATPLTSRPVLPLAVLAFAAVVTAQVRRRRRAD